MVGRGEVAGGRSVPAVIGVGGWVWRKLDLGKWGFRTEYESTTSLLLLLLLFDTLYNVSIISFNAKFSLQ